jgi:hypothetical protein
MIARYRHTLSARFIAGVSLVASIIGSASSASAVTCTFAFPTTPTKICVAGTSNAAINHQLVSGLGLFVIQLDWRGGTNGAAAWGIDVNGNQLSNCAQAVADDDVRPGITSDVSCTVLFGVPGTAPSARSYNHPVNMASTFVVVI